MFTICHSRENETPFYAYNIFPHPYGMVGDAVDQNRPSFTPTLLMRGSCYEKYFPKVEQQRELAKFFDKFMDTSKFYLIFGHLVSNGIWKLQYRILTFCIQVNGIEI